MGLGGSGGNRNDSDNEEEEETTVAPGQSTLTETSENESDDDDSGGGIVSGSASSSAGSGSGAGAGVGIGAGGVIGSGTGNEPDSTDPEDDEEDESEAEEKPPGEDYGTEDSEDPDDFPDSEEDEEQQTEEESEEEDEDQERQEAELVVYTDAWDATGWGIEPDLKHLGVVFGPSFDLTYELLSPRKLNRSDLESATDRYKMPYGQVGELPETTELSTTALRVAQDQDQDLFRDYLRRLRIAALVEGQNIEDQNRLVELADEVGFDRVLFEENWQDLTNTAEYEQTPVMWATVGDHELPWSGNLDYTFAFGVLIDNDVPPAGITPSMEDFVSEHEPVTTVEVAEIFEMDQSEALENLRQHNAITPIQYGNQTFWVAD